MQAAVGRARPPRITPTHDCTARCGYNQCSCCRASCIKLCVMSCHASSSFSSGSQSRVHCARGCRPAGSNRRFQKAGCGRAGCCIRPASPRPRCRATTPRCTGTRQRRYAHCVMACTHCVMARLSCTHVFERLRHVLRQQHHPLVFLLARPLVPQLPPHLQRHLLLAFGNPVGGAHRRGWQAGHGDGSAQQQLLLLA